MARPRFHARLLDLDSIAALSREMKRLEVDRGGIPLMAPKGVYRTILVENVPTKAANIIKQEILARGGDLATPWSAADFAAEQVDVLVIGNLVTLRSLIGKLYRQTVYHLPEFADALQGVLMRTVPGYLPVARQPARQGQVVEETLDDIHGGRIPLGPGGRATGVPELLPPAGRPDFRWEFDRRLYGVAVLAAAGAPAATRQESLRAAVAAGAPVLEIPQGALSDLAELRRTCPDRLACAPVQEPSEARAALAAGADILRTPAGAAPELVPLVAAAGALLWVTLPAPGSPTGPQGGPAEQPDEWDPLVFFGRQAWQITTELTGCGLSPGRLILEPASTLPGQASDPAGTRTARTLVSRLRELTSYGPPLAFTPPAAELAAMAATITRVALSGATFIRVKAERWPALAPALAECEGWLG